MSLCIAADIALVRTIADAGRKAELEATNRMLEKQLNMQISHYEALTSQYVTKADNERRVYNRIAPLMETRHANLKSVNYDMVVEPRSAEMDDYAKAKISTKLLAYCQGDTDFQTKKDKLISWAELTGTAFSVCAVRSLSRFPQQYVS